MDRVHPDKTAFDAVYNKIILEEIKIYQQRFIGCIELIPNYKDEIWDRYAELNQFCKNNYMKCSYGKLDRHKVSASYLIAIASVKPMRFVKRSNDKRIPLAVNETLAITVGLSVLRAFIIDKINEDVNFTDEEKKKRVRLVDNGIKLPDSEDVGHGNYVSNFSSELYFNIRDGNISILSVAHELYLLELLTMHAG